MRIALASLALLTLLTQPNPPSTPEPPKATTFKLEGNALILPSPILFKQDTATLDEDASRTPLYHLRDYLEAKPAITLLRIEGHVAQSPTLNAEAAQSLSEQRALAVTTWLTAHGIPPTRLLPVGFGSTKPLTTPPTDPTNTRITPINAQLRGHNIGSLPPDGGGKPAK